MAASSDSTGNAPIYRATVAPDLKEWRILRGGNQVVGRFIRVAIFDGSRGALANVASRHTKLNHYRKLERACNDFGGRIEPALVRGLKGRAVREREPITNKPERGCRSRISPLFSRDGFCFAPADKSPFRPVRLRQQHSRTLPASNQSSK